MKVCPTVPFDSHRAYGKASSSICQFAARLEFQPVCLLYAQAYREKISAEAEGRPYQLPSPAQLRQRAASAPSLAVRHTAGAGGGNSMNDWDDWEAKPATTGKGWGRRWVTSWVDDVIIGSILWPGIGGCT